MSSRALSPRYCTRATQLQAFEEMLQRWEPLASLCPISPARDLNVRPPAQETNALSHLALLLLTSKTTEY